MKAKKATKTKMVQYTHITEDSFTSLKGLIESLKANGNKTPYQMVMTATKRSYNTIWYIDHSETFAEYKEKVRNMNLKKKNGKVMQTVAEAVEEGNAALFEAAEAASDTEAPLTMGDAIKLVDAMNGLVTEIKLLRNDMHTSRKSRIFSRG